MAKTQFSSRRLAINKATATMVIIIGVAAFIAVFSLVASKVLFEQRNYQAKVISKKEKARDQLKTNIEAVDKLSVAFQEFTGAPQNVLGGSPNGNNGDRDGDNARIVLDALPSKYDFPALATSLEKIIKGNQHELVGITGTDDEIAQSQTTASGSPQPVEIPFSLEARLSQQGVKPFLELFERSIRPIQLQKLTLTTEEQDSNVTAKITGKTYYQPERNLNIRTEPVK